MVIADVAKYRSGPEGTRTYGQTTKVNSYHTFSNSTRRHDQDVGRGHGTGGARQSNSGGAKGTPGGQGRCISGAELSGLSHAG